MHIYGPILHSAYCLAGRIPFPMNSLPSWAFNSLLIWLLICGINTTQATRTKSTSCLQAGNLQLLGEYFHVWVRCVRLQDSFPADAIGGSWRCDGSQFRLYSLQLGPSKGENRLRNIIIKDDNFCAFWPLNAFCFWIGH